MYYEQDAKKLFDMYGEQLNASLDVDGDVYLDGKRIGRIEKLVEIINRQYHCNFEFLFNDEYLSVIRCKDCGTVVFISDESSNLDFATCPICNKLNIVEDNNEKYVEYESLYGCTYEALVYTKEDIESDKEKQKEIADYIMWQIKLDEEEERVKRRGMNDWELWKKEIKFKTRNKTRYHNYTLWLKNMAVWGIDSKLKGLYFQINILSFDNVPDGYKHKKTIRVPLTLKAYKTFKTFKAEGVV